MTLSPLDRPYRGGFVGKQHHFALTVYFEDTDTAGIVYYANYLKFMERARSDMIRAAGIDQAVAHHQGQGTYAVAEVDIRSPELAGAVAQVAVRDHQAHQQRRGRRELIRRISPRKLGSQYDQLDAARNMLRQWRRGGPSPALQIAGRKP